MKHRRPCAHIAAVAVAAALSLSVLPGCSSLPAPISDATSAVQTIVNDLMHPTSVAEARAQRRSELTQTVDDADLVTPGTLTVGIRVSGTAPFVVTGSGDSSYEGIDVDTAYALADALGLAHVEFVTVQSVSSGLSECDVVMGVGSDERGATVIGSYAQSALGVFSGSDAVPPISASDLTGATVGVQANSVSQAALDDLGLVVVEETFSNLNDAFEALASGSVDYVVCDAYAGAYLACVHGGISFAGTLDTPGTVGVAVSSDATSLASSVQAALDQIQTNGVAEIAKSRWVGGFPALTEATRVTGLELTSSSGDASAEGDATAEGDQGDATAEGDQGDAADGAELTDGGTDGL